MTESGLFDLISGYIEPAHINQLLLTGDVPAGFAARVKSTWPTAICEAVPVKTILAVTDYDGVVWPLAIVFSDHSVTSTDAEKAELVRLLARVRDVVASQVLHVCVSNESSHHSTWRLTDSLALGFSKAEFCVQGTSRATVYKYEISHYKSVPDWLNSKNWANPHRWDYPGKD